MTVLFERYKSNTGRHSHTDDYKCCIVNNWFHTFLIPFHRFTINLDEAGCFSIARKYKKPYYEMVEYKKDGYNIIKWINENIKGAAFVLVTTDYAGDLDINGNFIFYYDYKRARVAFTSKLDATAFKLQFLS